MCEERRKAQGLELPLKHRR